MTPAEIFPPDESEGVPPEPEPEPPPTVTVATAERMNHDDLHAALNERVPDSGFSSTGAHLPDPGDKQITAYGGVTEDQLLAAIDTATAVFTDYDENRAQITYNVETHYDAMKAWVAEYPDGHPLTPEETGDLVRLVNGIAAILLGDFETTQGT